MKARFIRAIALCMGLLSGSAQAVEIRYLMWDANQLPSYRQCAADFAKKNPGTTVKIRQMGWDDYWTVLSTGFIAGLAPDVFVNHLSHYPHYAGNDLLLDLAPLVRRDGLDMGIYVKGLVQPWQRDGKQYGLPKDWDTVGLMVNMAHAKRVGVSLAELQDTAWNPKDGGSFEQVMRRLTIDAQGRNATSADFDRKNVRMYGFQSPGPDGMAGQVEWSHFAVSNGFRYQDKPWDTRYRYDDPRLAETIEWLAGLPGKGISASYESARGLGPPAMFVSGKVAAVPDGSWMITFFASNAKFETAWVPLPKGPSGRRASMLNGLADSIWSGTKHKEESWRWVRYLASNDCQSVVAARGALFPAIDGLAAKVVEVHKAKGVDISAFLLMAKEQTFANPISDKGAEINVLMKHAFESVVMGKKPAAATLKEASDKVNKLLSGAP